MVANRFLTVLLLHSGITTSHAFFLQRQALTRHDSHVVLHSSKSSITTLNLVGEVKKTSEAAPTPKGKELLDFFSLPSSAPLILRGSKNNQIVEITDPDALLLDVYKKQCQHVNAHSPKPNDKLFDVTTSGVEFPGLKVMSVATIGVNIFVCDKGLPSYQFVLIRDSTYAEGNRIFVWFFNKVAGKNADSQSNESTTQSLNIIRTVPVGNGDIAFEANASLIVQVKVPSFLMKVIPSGKDKAEETGGKSICKVLEEDIPVALRGFREEYLQWLQR